MKTPKERDNLDLLDLVCELHSRALNYPSKEMHAAYWEARYELQARLSPVAKSDSEKKTAFEFHNYMGNTAWELDHREQRVHTLTEHWEYWTQHYREKVNQSQEQTD